MTDDEVAEQKEKAVKNALAILEEHFDAGVILTSHELPGGRTGYLFKGFGNSFAQDGMAQAFVKGEGNDA